MFLDSCFNQIGNNFNKKPTVGVTLMDNLYETRYYGIYELHDTYSCMECWCVMVR